MKFLSTTTSWSNIELGLLKACVLAAGIFIGILCREVLLPFKMAFLLLAVLLGIWLLYLWIKKMILATF